VRTAIPIIQLFTTLATTASIAIAGWLITALGSISDDVQHVKETIHQVDNRVTAIEQQQFTIKDSIALNEKILDKIGILDARLSNALNQPPSWLSEFVREQETRIKYLESIVTK
jgi:hypothetical protein